MALEKLNDLWHKHTQIVLCSRQLWWLPVSLFTNMPRQPRELSQGKLFTCTSAIFRAVFLMTSKAKTLCKQTSVFTTLFTHIDFLSTTGKWTFSFVHYAITVVALSQCYVLNGVNVHMNFNQCAEKNWGNWHVLSIISRWWIYTHKEKSSLYTVT